MPQVAVFLGVFFVSVVAGGASSARASSPQGAEDAKRIAEVITTLAAADPGDLWELELTGGQQLRAHVVQIAASTVTLRLTSGGSAIVDASAIQTVTRARAHGLGPDPHTGQVGDPVRHRYFWFPSALGIGSDELQVAQIGLVLTRMDFGVTDYLSAHFGSVMPLLFARDFFNSVAGLRASTSTSPWLHLGLSAEAYTFPQVEGTLNGASFILLTPTVTLGTSERHFSVSYPAPAASTRPGELADHIVALGGYLGVADGAAVLSEVVLTFSEGEDPHWVGTFGVRFFGDHHGFSFAIFSFDGLDIPLPMLDYTYAY